MLDSYKNFNNDVISGKILATCLSLSKEMSEVGVTLVDIDNYIEKLIVSCNAVPSFKGYLGYPCSSCISVNEQIVHGIPSNYNLKNGDLVTIDVGVSYMGRCTDAARTFFVGDKNKKEVEKMLRTCDSALDSGLSSAVTGNYVGDVSYSIQKEIEFNGFRSPYQLGGHGLSSVPHEEPFIPNYGSPRTGDRLYKGQKLAIEPIIIYDPDEVALSKDGWLWYCKDHSLSVHKEDTVIVWDSSPIILTRETLDGDLI